MVMNHDPPHTHTVKFRGQLFQNIEWKQPGGQTDAIDCFSFSANAVSNETQTWNWTFNLTRPKVFYRLQTI